VGAFVLGYTFLKKFFQKDNQNQEKSMQRPRRVSPQQRRNKVKSVFRRDMCVPENSSRPASVPKGCAQQAVIPHQNMGR